MNACKMVNSILSASSSVECLALFSASWVILSEVGLAFWIDLRASRAQALPASDLLPSSSQISSRVSKAKTSTISLACVTIGSTDISPAPGPDSPPRSTFSCGSANSSIMARTTSTSLPPHLASPSLDSSSSSLKLGTKCVARPIWTSSLPLTLAPHSAMYTPISYLALWVRKWVAPTSVKRPSAHSGMANRVFSVAMRKSPWTETPAPPPIVTPSSRATKGVLIVAMRWLSRYSVLKKLKTSSRKPCLYFSVTAFTSPPAQKAFPSPLRRIPVTRSPSSQVLKWPYMDRIIGSFRAFRALGLFRVTIRNPPRSLTSTDWSPTFIASGIPPTMCLYGNLEDP
mmetsp:Transcript_708/g.2808  ORF Transcript_708/g.2808 Transcript_708/m.2808 type:complete len:342 (-) Transcript_708:282-1307(-)